MSGYVKKHRPLRGGWDVGPEEYKAMGFTIGLPPNLYIPQTKQILDASQKIEHQITGVQDADSSFSVNEGRTLYDPGNALRCFINALPPDITEKRLKDAINHELYNRKLTLSRDVVKKIVINPGGKYAFVDFNKNKDAENFLELKDSFVVDGYTVRIRRSNIQTQTEFPEKPHCILVTELDHLTSETDIRELTDKLREMVGECADIEIPAIQGVTLGYALINPVETDLTDHIILKLRHQYNLKAERCFKRRGQLPRSTPSEISEQATSIQRDEFGYPENIKQQQTLKEGLSVADALNLDVDIATEYIGGRKDEKLRFLKIFNVTEKSPSKDLQIITTDMFRECEDILYEEYGKRKLVLSATADTIWPTLVPHIGPPIIVEFVDADAARVAQLGISGRTYRGRIVITSLSSHGVNAE